MSREPYKILIVEDEQIIALDIETVVERFGYSCVGTVANGRKAIELARIHKPDLILMDIQLEGEWSGIDCARMARDELGIPVVFLTSQLDKKTIADAILTKPYGYVVKPFEEGELFANIELALFKKQSEEQQALNKKPEENSFFVKDGTRLKQLQFSEVSYVEASENYVFIHTADRRLLIRTTMTEVERQLPPSLFARVHRSFIVAYSQIKSVQQDFILLENSAMIPLSRSFREGFMKSIRLL